MGPGAVVGFAVVLVVIGGLELFDRTSFALIALASRSPPRPTWLGGALAFVASTALAVTVGAVLVGLLGPERIGLVRVAGGVFLLGYAGWLYFHAGEEERVVERDHRTAFVAAFVTIFLLELGDDTMIFEIVFVTTLGALVVFVAGSIALVSVAAGSVTLGSRLGRRLDARRLDRIVVVVLVAVGALTIAYGLDPSAFAFVGG